MPELENSITEVRAATPIVDRFQKRLGTCRSVEAFDSAASAVELYKVESEKGTWLLKGHSTGTPDNQLRAEHTIVSALVENGFTLGVPFVLSDDGQPYVKSGNRCWTISRYIDDDPEFDWTRSNWSSETCASAAAGLAQLHLAGYRMLKRSTSIRSEFQPNQINTFTSKFHEAIRQLEKSSEIAASGLKEFTESTTWLREEVSTTVEQLHDLDFGHAPPTVLHGDFHAGNTLFQGDRLVAVVDFRYVHLGSPVYDLGYATVMFGTNWLRNEQDPQDVSPAIPEFQAAFAMAYRKAVRQLGPDPAWLAAVNDSVLLHTYMKLAIFLIMHWALEPTATPVELKVRNRIYVNALGLLRHMNVP